MAATRTNSRRVEARQAMLAIVADDWMEPRVIAPMMGVTLARVRQIADDLRDAQAIQLRRIKRRGRWIHEYRKTPPGHVEPLYESRMDAWPIAQVWGGYTFKGATQCQV